MSNSIFSPNERNTNLTLARLEKIVLDTLDFNQVAQKVADSILLELAQLESGYRIVVLGLIDEEKQVLRRVSISQTNEAVEAVTGLPLPYGNVEIPLSAKDNFCIKVLSERKPLFTHQWQDILTPPLTAEQAVLLQEKVGIKTSVVYPLIVRDKPIGMMIFSLISEKTEMSLEESELLSRYTDIVAITVQNSKLYSSLENTTLQLQKANQQLKELDKLKDEFVYIASHELRTPMTAIKNYLWLALNKHKNQLNPELSQDLERAYISTERLIRLVQDMLIVSRIEGNRLVFEYKVTDIYLLAKQVVDELVFSAKEKNISLILVPPQMPLMVKVDANRMMEVVQNLVGNALKFTPSGGTITVSFSANNGSVITSVTDTGPGISKEDQSRLFQKFGRLGHSYKRLVGETGTGLGLYICKQIISAHGGTIWVQSELDAGSTFSFSLTQINETSAAA